MEYNEIKNIVANKMIETQNKLEIVAPRTGKVIGLVSCANQDVVAKATEVARDAQKSWGSMTYKKRTEILFRARQEFENNKEEFIQIICDENGKTYSEAEAEVLKAIELCEFATSIPSVMVGRNEFVSTGIEAKELHFPVGVVASITPFNFPLMVPMWTIPNALVCGNAIVLKASEQTPITANKIAEIFQKAGLPDGLLNVVHGGKDVVESICDNDNVDVITFVGSSNVAEIVYKRSTMNLKRCLALGGAKNHILVTADVNPDVVAKEITDAAFGMSGQRCMAASVVLTIGDCEAVIDKIIEISSNIICGADIPPLITKGAVKKVDEYLNNTKGEIVVDGRNSSVSGNENGFYIGPSVIVYESYEDMDCEELFAPSLEIVRCSTLEEAISLQQKSPYANGASVFTMSGKAAMDAANGLSSGMLGVNVGVPVPRDPFSFGGLKRSKFGYGDITGFNSLNLFTTTRKLTTKWNAKDRKDWMS